MNSSTDASETASVGSASEAPVERTSGIQSAPASAVGSRIDVVSDVICPWCYIGKRQLERCLATLGEQGLQFTVHWNPFQLNPDMPREGRDRAEYRTLKFGSPAKAAELDRRITEAAAAVGLPFRMDLMTRTPNTVEAHRLIWFAGEKGAQDATVEAVFRAYFIEGRDIGSPAVLAGCAAEAGLDPAETANFLAGDLVEREVSMADQAAREAGVSGVPSFFLDRRGLFSGAMPADSMAAALRRGRTVLTQQSA